jgi:hypothetical protein
VAVNADPIFADLAALSCCGNDLAEAYALGRVLLAATEWLAGAGHEIRTTVQHQQAGPGN